MGDGCFCMFYFIDFIADDIILDLMYNLVESD